MNWSDRKDLEGNFSALTGFRGVAILWVIFAHLPLKLPELIERFQHRWGIGVDAFLAVSGFLVTRSLYQSHVLSEKRGKGVSGGVREFAVRRLARILPPYYVTMAAIAALCFVDPSLRARMTLISDILPSFLLFYSNYTIATHTDLVPTFLIMTWSLSYQEQFYAVLVSFYAMARRHMTQLILAASALSIILRFVMVLFVWDPAESHTHELGMWLHLRFDAVAWAALAWIHFDKFNGFWSTPARASLSNWAGVAGLAGVLAAHTYIPGDLAQAVIYTFKGPVLAWLVLSLVHLETRQTLLARFFRISWLGQLGVSAYEIYLLNTLVIAVIMRLPIPNQWVFFAACMGLSVVAGLSFYRLFGRWTKKLLRSALTVAR